MNTEPVEMPGDEAPVDSALYQATPTTEPISLDELAEEIRRQRILIRRGGVSVPIEALISIGGAVTLHAVMLTLLYFGVHYAVDAAARGHANWAAEADSGGNGGYMIMGTGPQGDPNLGGDVMNMLAKARTQEAPALPTLEQLPARPFGPEDDPAMQAPPVPMIGNPRSMADLGTPKFRPPSVAAPTVDVTNIVGQALPAHAAATHNDPDPTAVASVAGKTGTGAGARTPGTGLGGGDDDEKIVDIMKPGSGGTGSGSGKHAGNGMDRGASGANNENPQVLDAPPLDVPTSLRLKPPPRKAVFEVTVLANGTPGKIELTQPCGQPEIDALCQATVARYRFRPAYLAGQAITKSMTISFSFGTEP